jgi:hypothetical protein
MIQICPVNELVVETEEEHQRKVEFLRKAREDFAEKVREAIRAMATKQERERNQEANNAVARP